MIIKSIFKETWRQKEYMFWEIEIQVKCGTPNWISKIQVFIGEESPPFLGWSMHLNRNAISPELPTPFWNGWICHWSIEYLEENSTFIYLSDTTDISRDQHYRLKLDFQIWKKHRIPPREIDWNNHSQLSPKI